jgi:adenine-specific DNA-methyltransferase
MLETIDHIRKEATKKLDQSKRSELGQFMTPNSVAKFMVSLFNQNNHTSIELLDAGAGVGSLTLAFLNNAIQSLAQLKSITSTTYEIDATLLSYLSDNLVNCRNIINEKGIEFKTNIINFDFIEDAVSKIVKEEIPQFTHAILNPPYKKINSKSDHRKLLRLVNLEAVNLYSAFVGLSLLCLKEDGELVAIIPRSFCNGNYYKPFRELLIKNASIQKIHIFDRRNQAFKDDDVLQENIIIHLIKGGKQGNVLISKSTDENLNDLEESDYDFKEILKPGDTELFIHIPTVENHLDTSDNIRFTLKELNVDVSTGPVVDFRSKNDIFKEPQEGAVPLLYPIHFNCKEIDWPKVSKKPNAIAVNEHTQKMLYPKGFYTVIRRFSSKEEKQRIIARVINPDKLDFDFIGIENHLNVLHSKKTGLDEDLAFGLAAYLNSTYVDTHFRSFNGHTQVNATDLKQMKYPSRDVLITLGIWAKEKTNFDPIEIDKRIKDML